MVKGTPIPEKGKIKEATQSGTGVLQVQAPPVKKQVFKDAQTNQQHAFGGAKPKVLARPQTAGAGTQKMGQE